MSPAATLAKYMLAAGASHDEVVEAIAEMEAQTIRMMAEYQAMVAPVRSKGAERQARYRDRNKASQVTESDASDATPSPNKKNPPKNPLKELTLTPSVANATGADAPLADPVYTDSKHELWGEGVPILRQLGVKDREARSNIGRWLRDASDDAVAVLGAIQRARDHRVIDPVPWITRAIKAPHKLEVINGRQQRPQYRDLAESIIQRAHAARGTEPAPGGLLAHGGGVPSILPERGSG